MQYKFSHYVCSKKINYFLFLAVMALALLLPFSVPLSAQAALPSEHPLYEESADGEVWTIQESLPQQADRFIENPSCWYKEGTTVSFDTQSIVEGMEEWQHTYYYKRKDIAPIKYWKVSHTPAECIHSEKDTPIDEFHDISDVVGVCGANYYSGWLPYCADCDTILINALFYLSKDAVSQIDELELSKGYYYHCQFCGNLEQGLDEFEHWCIGISANRYMVKYNYNVPGQSQSMKESYHIYNNDYQYEGKVVIPQRTLNLCTFHREGYVFIGWSTEPGEQNVVYDDGAEIYNLTTENYDKNAMDNKGVITLYAQWKKVETTLIIDAGSGSYNGVKGTTEIVQEYNTFYTLDESLFTPGKGFQIQFESNGGNKIAPIQNNTVYKGYITGGNDHGRMAGQMFGNKYRFIGPLGTRDRIAAIWEQLAIILPEAKKDGLTFGGWYLDAACTKPVGGAGDSFTPSSDCTLYAKWVNLYLTSHNNMLSHDGTGAIDLDWTMPNGEGNAYVISQSVDGVTFSRVYDAKDSINPTETSIDGSYSYTGSIKTIQIPYSGYYEIEVTGAKGGDYLLMAEDDTKEDVLYVGGKGSKVTAKFYFQKGEVLTLTVGGQDGFASGGDGGEQGSPGGGFSGVYSNRQGWLIKTAGGGGGGISGDGGNADEGTTYLTESNGESGSFGGGGGGANGGLAGTYEVHTHTEECYLLTHEEHTTFELAPDSRYGNLKIITADDWAKDWNHQVTDMGRGYIKAELGYCNARDAFYGSVVFNGNTKNSMSVGFGLGAYEVFAIPTYGHEQATFTINPSYTHFVYAGTRWKTLTGCYLELYNQDGELLSVADITEELRALETPGGISDLTTDVVFSIPKGTRGIYFLYRMEAEGSSPATNHVYIYFRKLLLSTDKKELICGYEEGQVLSRQPSTGGKSAIFGTPISYKMERGVNEGNGKIELKALNTGFQENTSLKGVKATDTAPPKRIENVKIDYAKSNAEKLCITFSPTMDRGTSYYHKVDAYLLSTGSYLTTSNITKNTLTVGIKGYYYYLDSISHTKLEEIKDKNLLQQTIGETVGVELKEEVQYLHMAAVDNNGNWSETTHLKIPGTVEDAEELEGFSLEAWVERILYPHEPVFKRGESGELHIVTKGYADRVEVLFPLEMGDGKLKVYQVFHYDGTEFERMEKISFQVPLYIEEGEKEIWVWAYRMDETPEILSTSIRIQVEGSVLDEIRTRLR